MHSALYIGEVSHRRVKPVRHSFRYRLFMVYLDLAELDRVFANRWLWSTSRPNLAWLRRADHLGDPRTPLADALCDLVETHGERRPEGPLRMLTHLRYFGHCFNPVTFYYCFDRQDQEVETIVAEIHNTPWQEEFCYVMGRQENEGSAERMRFRFSKRFHISPFMPMEIVYDWEFGPPADRISVHMADIMKSEPVFEAQLDLVRRELSGWNLGLALMRFPLMTLKVIGAIYWQALRLRLKGAVYYPHPGAGPGKEVAKR